MVNLNKYPEVNAIIHRLESEVQTVLKDQFIGMYIHGSLALGDFNPDSSDIDFLVVTTGELSAETILSLKNMHECIAASDSKWAKKLEGSYISHCLLKQENPPTAPRPYINGGQFSSEQYGAEWVIEKYILREHGIVIAGPQFHTLTDIITPDHVRKAVLSIFHEWWLPMLQDSTRLNSDEYQAYAILTMCRILYTLNFGVVGSKPVSAIWAKNALKGKWPQTIDQAIAWCDGQSLNLLDETLEFIQLTKDTINLLENNLN